MKSIAMEKFERRQIAGADCLLGRDFKSCTHDIVALHSAVRAVVMTIINGLGQAPREGRVL